MMHRILLSLIIAAAAMGSGCSGDDGSSGSDAGADTDTDADTDADTDTDTDTDTDADTDTDTDTDTDADSGADSGADTDVDADTDTDTDSDLGPTLEIVVVGDATSDVEYGDSYASQTPSSFVMGIQRVELMTSDTDTSPVTVFDAGDGSYTEIDMLGTTSLTTVHLSDLADGVYTKAKVLLAMTRFQIDTTVHVVAASFDGTADVVAALSDTTIDSSARSKGWMQYTFHYNSLSVPRTDTLPPFPTSATGEVIDEADKTWLLMDLSSSMTISPSITSSYVATVTMKVKDCFRWEDDTATSGYTVDVFDSKSTGEHETVASFGPGEFSILVE